MSPLISTAELRDRLGSVTVLDVRYRPGRPDRSAYAAAHIPERSTSTWTRTSPARPGPAGRHPLPTPHDLAAAMRRCGVRNERAVVVYDDWSARAAGRCWWLLRHHGHRDVRVLDGGWSTWTTGGHPVEAGELEVPPGDFTTSPGDLAIVSAGQVPDVGVLIDARAPERHRGEVEPLDPVAGHIPDSVNVPTSSNLRPEGTFRPADELRSTYAAVGAVPGADVAVYCGSGVTATHDLLALEVIGVRARLYPGSWSEWTSDPARPVVRGRLS